MSFGKAWPFQAFVYSALEAGLPNVEGFSHIPTSPPDRYWRIEGWTISPSNEFKDTEGAHHGVTVHLFDNPDAGTKSLQWVKENSALVISALENQVLDTASNGLRVSSADVDLVQRDDKLFYAHFTVRLTAKINAQ